MRIQLRLIFSVVFVLSAAGLFAQSATLTENINNESTVRTTGGSIIITLTDAKVHGDIGSTNPRADVFLAGMSGQSTLWDAIIATLDRDNVTVNGDSTQVEISIGAYASYFIDENDTITFTIPDTALHTPAVGTLEVTTKIIVLNEDPVISIDPLTLSEADIRSGTNTFDIEISYDEWETSLTGGFNSYISGGAIWNADVQPSLGIARQSNDTIVQVTIPQVADFNIETADIISIDVDAADIMHTGSGTFSTTNKIDITLTNPEIEDASATFDFDTEQDIRDAGSSITLTLSMDDSLLTTVETDDALREALIRGLQFSNSQSAGEAQMEEAILWSDFGATFTTFNRSTNSVTFNIPAIPLFNIDADVDVSFEIPASCLELSATSLTYNNLAHLDRIDPSLTIASDPASPLAESSLDGSIIKVKLDEATWDDTTLDPANFTLNVSPAIAGLSIDHITHRGSNSCDIYLEFTGNIDQNSSISLQSVDGSEFSYNEILTISSGTVGIAYETEPVVSGLSVTGGPFGIGDILVVDIQVEDDDGNTFTLGGGSIANRTLEPDSLHRISSTLYRISFTIEEGSDSFEADVDLPVSGLQLYNGTIPGNIYSIDISQGDDEIDALRPVITQVSFNGGEYKIGEKLTATILSESDLTFDNSTSINGLNLLSSNVTEYYIGNGLYQIEYVVESGNNDVKEPDWINISVVLADGAGNINEPVVPPYSGTRPQIDANRPTISATLISSGTLYPNDVVIIQVSSAESGLEFIEGTLVNGVEISDPDLDSTSSPGYVYELAYTVDASDPEVNGNLEVEIVMVDDFGNTTTLSGGVDFDVSGLDILTSKPEVVIYGSDEVCEGEQASIYVRVTNGTAPYTVSIADDNGPTTNHTIPTANVNTRIDLSLAATGDHNFSFSSVLDDNSVPGIGSGDALVVVNTNPIVRFDPALNTIYSVTDLSGHTLTATPSGGVFSGIGVVSAEDKFYPSVAGINDSTGFDLHYDYVSTEGCEGSDVLNVTVLEETGQVRIETLHENDEVICFDDPLISVVGNNVDNQPGTFKLYRLDKVDEVDVSSALVPTASDTLVYVDPAQLIERSASYRVKYTYTFKDKPYDIYAVFEFDYISEIAFSSLIPAQVCNDESKKSLEAKPNDGEFEFTGPGVEFEGAAGYKFYPDQGVIGNNVITYEFTSDLGCVRSDFTTIENFEVPEVDFTPQELCVSPVVGDEGGGPVHFTNNTTSPALVSKWIWNFDDIASLENNIDTIIGDGSTAIEGYHYFTAPLSSNVSLKVETVNGCDAEKSMRIDFGAKPRASFRAESNCWLEGLSTDFSNSSENYNKDWHKYTWEASSIDGSWDTIFSDSIQFANSAQIYFPSDEVDYTVRLYVENTVNDSVYCSDDTARTVVLKPTESFDNKDFILMDFEEDGFEKWSLEADSTSKTNSWTRGVPDFSSYHETDNNMALYTDKQALNSSERSWIQSRCFDFSSLERPMIRMDLMGSMELDRDGAVVQYTIDDGQSWNTVGNIEEGINWYNSFEILSQPGGGEELNGRSPIGWTGKQVFTADTNYWVTVAHDLDYANLEGAHRVIFGVFFASDNSSEKHEGIAVDNIYIGERKKKTLVEHFTSSGDVNSKLADDVLDDFIAANEMDVTSLQYHMHYPGNDWMNANNPVPASARSFYYGVNQVPYAYLNGGIAGDLMYDFVSTTPDPSVMKALTLEEPEFEIGVIKKYIGEDYLRAQIYLKALNDLEAEDRMLYVAVVEKELTTQDGENGDSMFRNVVFDILPDAGGIAYTGSWATGDSLTESYRWTFDNVENPSELMMVVFLQEKDSKNILQVETIDDFALVSSFEKEFTDLVVYPNPASTNVYIENRGLSNKDFSIMLCDLTGRKLLIQNEPAGKSRVDIDVSNFAPGPYIIIMKEAGQIVGRSTVLIAR